MNEKIKELVKKVGGLGYTDDNEEMTPCLVGNQIERFVQLVIEDCADQLEKNYATVIGSHANAHNTAILKCKDAIRELFTDS